MVDRLPDLQFHGQKFIDAYGIVYVYDAESDCFVNTGSIEHIVDSSIDNTGLMIAEHKRKLDSIPDNCGGFAIIIDPKFKIIDENNLDGLIYGDIKLVSESIDITCINHTGEEIKSNCYACVDGINPPGLNFQISQKFLDSFCVKLPIIPGSRGDKGDEGEEGDPGTGDGPPGEMGDPGISYYEPGTFSGVKVFEIDGIYDKAIVDLKLSNSDGILTVIKAPIALPDSNTPAGQVYCTPVFRDVKFNPELPKCGSGGNLWQYDIIKGDDDLPNDLLLYVMPNQINLPGISEVSTIPLSKFIEMVINDLKPQYEEAVKKYDEEIKNFLYAKDAECRHKLCSLARQLSECEWQLPLEYCIGISPCEAESAAGRTAAAVAQMVAQQEAMVSSMQQMTQVGPFAPCPQ